MHFVNWKVNANEGIAVLSNQTTMTHVLSCEKVQVLNGANSVKWIPFLPATADSGSESKITCSPWCNMPFGKWKKNELNLATVYYWVCKTRIPLTTRKCFLCSGLHKLHWKLITKYQQQNQITVFIIMRQLSLAESLLSIKWWRTHFINGIVHIICSDGKVESGREGYGERGIWGDK